jgi:predicted transposase YbfD/YdcC
VENSLHWRLAVMMNEGEDRTRLALKLRSTADFLFG